MLPATIRLRWLLLAALLLPSLTRAQTQQLDQRCLLLAANHANGRASLQVVVGSGEDEQEDATRVEEFSYEADALNYLRNRGWEVTSIITHTSAGGAFSTRYGLRRPRLPETNE